jgi:hypothetical protein
VSARIREGERGDRSDARHAHQPPADLLPADDVEHLLRQTTELVQHRGEDRKERLDERHHQPIIAGKVMHSLGEGRAVWRAEFDAAFPQHRPHHVLDRSHLVQNRAAGDQERAPQPALPALDVDLPIPAGAHDLRQRAGIVAVGLVRHRLHRRIGAARFDADRQQAGDAQLVVQPSRQRAGLQADALKR